MASFMVKMMVHYHFGDTLFLDLVLLWGEEFSNPVGVPRSHPEC